MVVADPGGSSISAVPGLPKNLHDRLSRTTSLSGALRWLRLGYLLARRVVAALGFELIYISYDSPVPDLNSLERGIFGRPSPMRGVEFDVERQLQLLEDELAGYCREFAPPLTEGDAGGGCFYLRNGTYESVDAELLYAMVRRFKPRRVLELGSGYSTLIIREALARDVAASVDGVLRTYDPYRSDLIPPEARVTPLPVQEIPEAVFQELEAGDLLFVDTSHTVKLGGDVNRIVLDLLPLLAPGVIVHFHDIFLPYPYSRAHLEDAHFWTEQYLLQAFLSGNDSWEVLIGAHAIARAQPQRLALAIPSFAQGVNPGAFWIRRRV
jgi:hypothetical protein